jgi:hypothetical protein
MANSGVQSWLSICGAEEVSLERDLSAQVAALEAEGRIPPQERERVSRLSLGIANGAFVTSPKRLELLRNLCQLYSAGIRAEKFTSHRPVIGPLIVFVKKRLYPIVSALLGPSFRFQRDFNAGVIRLLGDLCNEAREREEGSTR